jgi:hypothetical protein
MRITCMANLGESLPDSYLAIGYTKESIFHVKIASEYLVYGIAVYRGIVLFLLLDDVNLPNWYPADLFSIADPKIPANWLSAVYPRNMEGLNFLIGYKALIADDLHYDALLERAPEALKIFHEEVVGGQ